MRLVIFLFVFNTGWKAARDSSKDTNEFRGVYAQTDFGTHDGTSSREILEVSSDRGKSWYSRSSVPDLDEKNNIHLRVGLGGQGLDHGTTVTAFQHTTSAPSHWLSSSLSAVLDKETAPLPQEVSHNYPDMPGDTPRHSTTEGGVNERMAAMLGQAVLGKPEADSESESPTVLKSSTHSPMITKPFRQSPACCADVEPRHEAVPPLTAAGLVDAPSSGLPLVMAVTSPASLPKVVSQWSGSSSHAPSPRDLGGNGQIDISIVPSKITSVLSEDDPVKVDTSSMSPTSQLRLTALDPVTKHSPMAMPISAPADNVGTKDYILNKDRLTVSSGTLGTGEREITERHTDFLFTSGSTLGLSQGWKADEATDHDVFIGRGLRSATDKGLPLGSGLEGMTYLGGELHQMTTGRTELNARGEGFPKYLSSPRLDVPLFTNTEGLSTTHVVDIVDNATSEDTEAFRQSKHPGSHLTTTDIYGQMEDQGIRDITTIMDSSTFHIQQELTNTDLHPSVPHTNPLLFSSQSYSTQVVNTQPESSGSTLSNSYSYTTISLTAMSESSFSAEGKTNQEYIIQRSTSSHEGTRLMADSTLQTTIGFQINPTAFKHKFTTSLAHQELQELTTTPHVVSITPALTQRTGVSHSPDERTNTSNEGRSENDNSSTDHTTLVPSHSVNLGHTLTVSSIETARAPLSTRAVASTVVHPSTSSKLEVSSTVRGPIYLSGTPRTAKRLSPSVPSGVNQASTHNCRDCPLVTVSPTVSLSERSTRHGSVRTTTALPLTPAPKITSEAPGIWLDPLTPERGGPTDPASAHTIVSSNGTTPRPSVKPVKEKIFIVEDQPAIIKEKTTQLLLQIVLASWLLGDEHNGHFETLEEEVIAKLRPFLQKASGFQDLQLSWTSTATVVQSVATFDTATALPWLGVAGVSLLEVTGLSDAVAKGLYVNGAQVEKITMGGLPLDPCSWLFLCPSGFQCVPASTGNASCTSLCHADYCLNGGICTHHRGQQPMCQCPVGENFWFMGRRCDSQMTQQRLVAVCLGVLVSIALLMAAVSFLVIRHFKAMLIQAKVDQTRSSYRRFNHFDELSGRFWLRSWPGSVDSLDNPVFSHSNELLHLRALDQACCYHDDTLSVVSTCHGSGTQLNTIYAHGSQYNWDLSGSSINDFMADSGKASDLSVCSWPIEPIQWTPFPLLHQLGGHRPGKTARPRSYCEGMELVDLEKTWTVHQHG